MKLRRLTFKQEMTFWITFDGINAVWNSIDDNYVWIGIWIAFGIIMIYFREKYGGIL